MPRIVKKQKLRSTQLPHKWEKVLITGITDQDGSYPAEFILEKGYEIQRTIYNAPPISKPQCDYTERHKHLWLLS